MSNNTNNNFEYSIKSDNNQSDDEISIKEIKSSDNKENKIKIYIISKYMNINLSNI